VAGEREFPGNGPTFGLAVGRIRSALAGGGRGHRRGRGGGPPGVPSFLRRGRPPDHRHRHASGRHHPPRLHLRQQHNRTGLTTSVDNPDGTAGTPSTTSYTYDTADRLTTTGTVYDAFGRTTTQASSATIGYYTNDLVRQQTSGTNRQTWTLDAAGRLGSWTTESNASGTWTQTAAKTNHYGSDTDSPDWVAEDTAGNITRNVQGIGGDLDATTTATGGTILQLTDLHGDVTVQLPVDTTQAPTVAAYDEYGNPESGTPAARYGWLGGKQRSSETITGATLMGVRLYDPTTGRFLQTDPVPGGSANAYDYCSGDPVNHYDLDGRFWGHRSFWGAVSFFSYRSWINSGNSLAHGHVHKAWSSFLGGAGSPYLGELHNRFCNRWCRSVAKHAAPSAWSRFGKFGGRALGWEVSVIATGLDYAHSKAHTHYSQKYWSPGYGYGYSNRRGIM